MTQADSVHSTPPINTSALPDGLVRQQREREKALKRAAKLRQKAADEIERLLAFLDASDPFATELEQAVDDGPCDADSDAEPSLGSFDRMIDQTKAWQDRGPADVDCELDTVDAEPMLASVAADEHDSQERWAQGNRDDREGDPCCDDRESDAGQGHYPSKIGR
jgi:hypothetical protein